MHVNVENSPRFRDRPFRTAMVLACILTVASFAPAVADAQRSKEPSRANAGVKIELSGVVSQWSPVLTEMGRKLTGDTHHLTMIDSPKYGLVQLDMGGVHLTVTPGSKYRAIGLLYEQRRFVPNQVLEVHHATEDEAHHATDHEAERGAPMRDQEYLSGLEDPEITLPQLTSATMLIIPFYCSTASIGSTPGTATPADYENLVTSTISPWFGRQSNGQRSFIPTSTPWLDRCTNGVTLSQDDAAVAAGYNPSAYDRVVYVDSAPNLFVLGIAENIPGRRILITQGSLDPGLWSHELGHLEGLFHANTVLCTDPNAAGAPAMYSPWVDCNMTQYGDFNDTMGLDAGSVVTPILRPFSAGQRAQNGWLAPGALQTVTASGTYSISSISDPTATGPTALRIPHPTGTLFVEYRTPVGDDAWISGNPQMSDGVQVRVKGPLMMNNDAPETRHHNLALIDGTPSTPTLSDAALPWNTPMTMPQDSMTISAAQNSSGGADLTVTFPNPHVPSPVENLTAVFDPVTGTAIAQWDPPLRLGGGMFYIVAPSPTVEVWDSNDPLPAGWQLVPGNQFSATVPALPDGFTGVSVAALSIGAGTGAVFTTSNLWWSHRSVTASNLVAIEGTGANTTYSIPATASRPAPIPSGISYFPVAITATAGSDYINPVFGAWSLQFPAGSTQTNAYLTVVGDAAPEPSETVQLYWIDNVCPSGSIIPGCSVNQPLSTITIHDDD